MQRKYYDYRYVILLVSLFLYLFDSLLFTSTSVIQQYLEPINTIILIAASLLLFRKAKYLYPIMWTIAVINIVLQILSIAGYVFDHKSSVLAVLNIFFFGSVVLRVFHDIRRAKYIDFNMLMATFSGLVLLGIIGFAIFLAIESAHPGSFSGLEGGGNNMEDLFYFSYISMMTVGFGDITPLTPLARRATILMLLLGNFYTLIVTALVIGKYLAQQSSKKNTY